MSATTLPFDKNRRSIRVWLDKPVYAPGEDGRWIAAVFDTDGRELEYSDHLTWESAMQDADDWARGIY